MCSSDTYIGFYQCLKDCATQKGITIPQLYKAVGLDRKRFCKLKADYNRYYSTRCGGYCGRCSIDRDLAIAFGLALNLRKEKMLMLLHIAGYSLSETGRDKVITDLVKSKPSYVKNLLKHVQDGLKSMGIPQLASSTGRIYLMV